MIGKLANKKKENKGCSEERVELDKMASTSSAVAASDDTLETWLSNISLLIRC